MLLPNQQLLSPPKIDREFEEHNIEINISKFGTYKPSPLQQRIETILDHLDYCGKKNIVYQFKCKKCLGANREALLKELKDLNASCGLRYCKHPDCIASRYAKTLSRIGDIKYKQGNKWVPLLSDKEQNQLKRKIENPLTSQSDRKQFQKDLKSIQQAQQKKECLHMTIGFQAQTYEDIKTAKKQHNRLTNNFLAKLRKGNLPPTKDWKTYNKTIKNRYYDKKKKKHCISEHQLKFWKDRKGQEQIYFKPTNIRAPKVFDLKYNFITKTYLLHWHFAIIPNYYGEFLDFNVLQYVRKEMLKKAKKKQLWHLQFHTDKKHPFGYKPIKSVLVYMTKRAIGIYGKSDNYKKETLSEKKIRDIVNDQRIYFLPDIMNVQKYAETFWNTKVISYVGKNIKGYIYNDIPFITEKYPTHCKFCGELSKEDIKLDIFEEKIPPPPNNQEQPKISVEKISWTSPGHEKISPRTEQEIDKLLKICKFENYERSNQK